METTKVIIRISAITINNHNKNSNNKDNRSNNNKKKKKNHRVWGFELRVCDSGFSAQGFLVL